MAGNVCWGIEIGAAAIKAVKLEPEGAGARVLDFAVIPHRKVLSEPGVDPSDVVRVTLGTLATQIDLSGAKIAISIPGHSSFARFAKLPPVEAKKVPDIVKFEAVQQIPFPLEEVEWDYQTFQSPDSPEVEVGIFAVTKEKITEQLTMLADVGIVPDIVTLSPVAAFNALAWDLEFTEDTPGTIILDVGTTSSDLIISEAGRVWVRTFPLGGHQFTNALIETFKLGYPKAEKLKREAATTKYARHVFQAMRPVFADLSQDVQRSLNYYAQSHKDAGLERLVGLGSTFTLPGLRKFMKQQLSMDVYKLEQFKRVLIDDDRKEEFEEHAISLVTAMGLALQGIGFGTINANLMPVPVLRSSMWAKKNKWFAAAAVLAVLASGAMFIRPMLDGGAKTMSEPSIVSTAMSTFNRLKRDAEEAGVLGGGAGDFTAAKLLTVFDDREVYPFIVDDTSQMLEAAQADWTRDGLAFDLQSLETEYLPPDPNAGGGEDGGFGAPPQGGRDGRGGRDGGFGGRSGGGGGGPADDPNKGFPRVKVTMVLETPLDRADAQTYYLKTVDSWISRHESREDAPYTIFRPANNWQVGDVNAPADPGGRGRPDRRPPDPGDRGGRDRPPPDGGGRSGGQSGGVKGPINVEQMAPIDAPSIGEPPRSRVTATWFAVVMPPAPEGEDELGGGQ